MFVILQSGLAFKFYINQKLDLFKFYFDSWTFKSGKFDFAVDFFQNLEKLM